MTAFDQPTRATFSSKPHTDLLTALEASLHASRTALLSRNLARLEQHTSEQLELHRKFSELLSHCTTMKSDLSASSGSKRILHLTRVHLALLERARQSLRMLVNATTAHATYAPRPGTATVEISASGEE